MYVCGPDSSTVLGVKSNNNLNGAPIVCPPLIPNIDVSKLTSYSIYSYHSIIITNDGIMKAIGSNRNNRIAGDLPVELTNYTEFQIKDKEGNICTPISAVCGNCYTLYLVSNPSNKEKNQLAYSSTNIQGKNPIFLNVGNHNPTVLYGGENHSASIDSEGQILIVPDDIESNIFLDLPVIQLPNNEKAINVACLENYLIALSSTGKLYISQYQDIVFTEVKELSNIQIVQISGVMLHCLAVSNDGRVFGFGSNIFGKLTLPNEIKEVEKFTELKSFGRSKIKSAFAGFQHSFFITYIGQLFACGVNKYGQLFLDHLSEEFVGKPVETFVKDGVSFCIAGNFCSVAFTDCVPPKMPNRNSESIKSKAPLRQQLAAFPSLKRVLQKV